jgi:hypothetical protein
MIDELKAFLQKKFDYCAEQSLMNLEAEGNSEIASYFRERKELYLDRANIYGEVMREIDRLAEEHNNVMIDEQYCFQTCGATEHCKECNRLCNGDIDYYENYDFMAEEHNNGWIACEERLPEVGVPVLVCNAQGKVYIRMINWISSGRTQIPYWSQQSTGIIAWQPLPTPYMPKGE